MIDDHFEDDEDIQQVGLIWHENEITFRNSQLEFHINETNKYEKRCISKLTTLTRQLAEYEDHVDELDDINKQFDSSFVHHSTPSEVISSNLRFFDQLRLFESKIDRLKGHISGLREVGARLEGEIKVCNAHNHTLRVTNSKLQQDSDDSHKRLHSFESELSQCRHELASKDAEYNELYHTLQKLKNRILTRSTQISSQNDTEMAVLISKDQELVCQLSQAQTELQQILKKEVSMQASSASKTELLRKQNQTDTSSQQWISERTSLIAKVKKARQELQNIQNRNRSTSRQSNPDESDPSEIKSAILNEIKFLREHSISPRLPKIRQTEDRFKATMMLELDSLETLMLQIASFRDQFNKLIAAQEVMADDAVYRQLLRNDLDSHRRE